jgi:hypothetical protein
MASKIRSTQSVGITVAGKMYHNVSAFQVPQQHRVRLGKNIGLHNLFELSLKIRKT